MLINMFSTNYNHHYQHYYSTNIIILIISIFIVVYPELSVSQIAIKQSYQSLDLGYNVHKLLLYSDSYLFVGAQNKLFKINSTNLQTLEDVTIGPVNDNVQCKPNPEACSIGERTKVDAECKNLFTIKLDKSVIIAACYSTNQGMCYIFPPQLVKAAKLLGSPNTITNYVASRASSYVLSVDVNHNNLLIIAHAYDGRPLDLSPAAISSRVIRKSGSTVGLDYTVKSVSALTAIDLLKEYKEKFKIDYIYGFKDGDHGYFVKTEPDKINGELIVTKVARICLGDSYFGSYSEIELSCDGLTKATSAVYGPMDEYLKGTFGESSNSQSGALFVAFEKKKGRTHGESRICAFSVSQLSAKIDEAKRACYARQSGSRVEIFAGPNAKCTIGDLENCTSTLNKFIQVNGAFAGHLIYGDTDQFTSLVSIIQGKNPSYVLFAGTDQGHIKKIAKGVLIYSAHTSETKIEPDPVIDFNQDNIFFASGSFLFKFPVKSCNWYSDCGSCILSQSKDPNECIWDGSQCVPSEGKSQGQNFCQPRIASFTPKKGPINGGTLVTIKGFDLGFYDKTPSTQNDITIAETPCSIKSWNYTEIICQTQPVDSSKTGPISIKVKDTSNRLIYDISGSTQSTEFFSYLKPELISIEPKFSPFSGGINVILRGKNLDIGNNLSISLAGVACDSIQVIDSEVIECVAGSVNGKEDSFDGPIVIKLDSASLTLDFDKFIYKSDPVFQSMSPEETSASTGINITITGYNFDSLYKPRMVIHSPRFTTAFESDCIIISTTQLLCPSPKVNMTDKGAQSATVTFKNGGSSQQVPTDFLLTYYPDPDFGKQISTRHGPSGTRVLEIQGSHIRTSYGMKVYLVNREDQTQLECKGLRSIDGTTLACEIPLEEYEGNPTASPWKISVIVGDKEIFASDVQIDAEPDSSATIAGILIGIIAAIVVIVAVLLFFLRRNGYLLKKKVPIPGVAYRSPENGQFQRQGSQNEYHGTESRISGQPLLNRTSDEIKFVIDPEKQVELMNDGVLFSREYVNREKIIGQGNFGLVYQGYLELPGKDEKIKVAIKTLKTDRGILTQAKGDAFLAEGLIMKEFCHENVLTLLGVAIDFDGSPMLLTPFMGNGDLRSFIQREELEFTVIELIQFGIQVAQGMNYLAGLKFVHRDLAARNCMVDEHRTIKVADFGLSRDVYTTSYYSDADNFRKPLPRKWMALESLERGIFDTKSDVWSYGVLLWELLTRGDIPYPDIEDWKMKDYLKAGYRLPRPELCPPEVYTVMRACWVESPKTRPSFEEILKLIEVAIENNERKYLEQKMDRNVRYINDPSIFSNPEYDGTLKIR